jgi:hypothetical protein
LKGEGFSFPVIRNIGRNEIISTGIASSIGFLADSQSQSPALFSKKRVGGNSLLLPDPNFFHAQADSRQADQLRI